MFLNHVNISKLVCAVILTSLMYRQYDPNKIPTRFLEEVGKLIINFMQKSYGSGIFKILH